MWEEGFFSVCMRVFDKFKERNGENARKTDKEKPSRRKEARAVLSSQLSGS